MPPCQYRLFFDGQSFTFAEDDHFLVVSSAARDTTTLSPDASLVTFLEQVGGEGGQRWIANADGTRRRKMPAGCHAIWPPERGPQTGPGSSARGADGILVVDVGTRQATEVAEGTGAIWLDDHTLLIDLD